MKSIHSLWVFNFYVFTSQRFSCDLEEDFLMKLANRIITFVLVVALLFTGMGTTVEKVINDVKLGLDLQGGFEVLYKVESLVDGQKITQDVLADTTMALNERVNEFGV